MGGIFFGALNNREIALGLWIGAFAIWALLNKDIRKSFKAVLDAFFVKRICVAFAFLTVYILVIIWLLHYVDFWNINQLKNSVFWFASVAAVSFFRLSKIADNPKYFEQTIKDNLKIIVFICFILKIYTFNIYVELLFVPFVTMVTVLCVYAKSDEKYKAASDLLSRLVYLTGLIVVLFTGYKLLTDFSVFAKEKTFYDLTTPMVLSMMLLPYVYIQYLYLNYEKVYARMYLIVASGELQKYAIREALFKFRIDIGHLKWWIEILSNYNVAAKSDVDRSISAVKKYISETNTTDLIPDRYGWIPKKTVSILENYGLKTGPYRTLDGEEWLAVSPYLEIEGGYPINNIAFYLSGNYLVVKSLKLIMNINNVEKKDNAYYQFVIIASKLYMYAMNEEIPSNMVNAIAVGSSENVRSKDKIASIFTENRENNKGYTIKLTFTQK